MKRFTNMQWSSPLLLLLLVLGVMLGACSADVSWNETAVHDESASLPAQERTGDKDRDETSLRAAAAKTMQHEASEAYAAIPEAAGRYLLANAAQRMTATADRSGLLLRANASAASFSLRTSGYGCEGALQKVDEREPLAVKNRLAYARPEFAMDEWYLNGPLGVEQGFSIKKAASCTGTKVITMEALGDVAPVLEDADGDGRGDRVRLVADQGEPGFWYRDLAVVDASGKKLAAWMTVEAGGMAIHFDDAGAVYPVEVDPLIWLEQQKLTASDGAAYDYFGVSVALSGDTAIVGAYYDDIGANAYQGSAYVFVRSAGVWTEQAKLTASDGSAGDWFGFSVALAGDTAIVGAERDNDKGTASGSAYVFVRSAGVWTEQVKLTASDGAADDYFGGSVALSGDTAIVGAFSDTIGANSGQGSAYIFVKPAMGWATTSTFAAKLTASDGAAFDKFGGSVALSGDTAIVGASQEYNIKGTDAGAAYVFVKPAMGWATTSTFDAKLTASDGAGSDKFGWSVALSGDTAIVGACGHDIGVNADQGSAYIFVKPAMGWATTSTFAAKLTASDGAAGDVFGCSVALDGDTAIVGACGHDIGVNADQGSAYIFVKPAMGWATTSTFAAKLTASDGAANDEFGRSVALSGDTATVGAFRDEIGVKTDQGSAYVFHLGKANGDACVTDGECASSFCDSAGNVCACTQNSHCASGQVCDTAANPNQCTLCGNGVLNAGEGCDDGNTANGDGCNAGCLKELGYTCAAAASCASGFCVDGVCCNSACTGTCQACSAVKNGGTNGTCGSITVNTDPDNECFTECNGAGACEAANGAACTVASQCQSGFCVDGACCSTSSCLGTCKSCNVPGSAGTCANILSNTDPDNECFTECNGAGACEAANGAACTLVTQCQSGFCADGVCCDSQCTGTCQACTAAKNGGTNGTCGSIPANADPDNECATECNGTGACEAANGVTCLTAAQCQSGNCVDGFCCNFACTGTCQACSAAKNGGTNGTCDSIPSNADPDNECVTECNGAGACEAVNGTACTFASQCQSGLCVDTVCCIDDACKALDECHVAGTCQLGTGTCSNPNQAEGTPCSNGSCHGGTCIAASCGNTFLEAGETCDDGNTSSGDGCDSNCTPTGCGNGIKTSGEACDDGNTSNGDGCDSNCKKELGQACTTAGDCFNNTCVDNVCCAVSACTASDQCHDAGTCQPGTGICDNPAKADGSSCNDSNACTQSDTCQAGSCTGANPITCTALDQCHVVGTCNPATGQCSNPNANDGTACNDGNACTQSDTCQAGACIAGALVVCTASDQCHDVGTCDSMTGLCSNPNKANGSSCNDNDACTQMDTCQAGACIAGTPVVCSALDQCHDAGTCNSATGTCNNPEKPNGSSCNDNNACTQSDTCQAGTCTGANPVMCAAMDACHVAGSCDPMTGMCSNPNAADGTNCSDNNACTQMDTCQAGACTGANPVMCAASDQCHDPGTCDSMTGLCSNPAKVDGSSCNDNNACTQSDTCQSGTCIAGTPVVCSALDQCHDIGTCDSMTGLCDNPNKADGSSCDDNNACTQMDTCQAGTCTGANPVTCTALDQCHDIGTCDSMTGLCSNPAKADGSSCNDSNACTQSDTCQSGTCTGANPVDCSPKNECHEAGTCDPSTGTCSIVTKPDGSLCTNGTCQNAECIQVCQTAADCRPDPRFFDCIDNQCIPRTEGPLSSTPGCACSTTGDRSSRPGVTLLLVALSAFWARRKRTAQAHF